MLLLPLLLPLGDSAAGRASKVQDPQLAEAEKLVEGTLLALGQLDTRLTVPVAVGDHGPYNFIIDTGSERTVVSRELAGSLRLNPGNPVMVTSMTGRRLVDTVLVPDLSIKSIGLRHTIVSPSLEARHLGAIGLLGIDTLHNHAVSIDFESGTMRVRPSRKRDKFRATRADEIVVTAKNAFGQLIVTDAYYENTRIHVVLDTGSQITIGNSALRRRLGHRIKQFYPVGLTSVTGEKILADYTTVSNIRVGRIGFDAMPVAFADVAPFEYFGLKKRPAILLGMDVLRSFARVDIDFPNRMVRFSMPSNVRKTRSTSSLTLGMQGY